MKERFDALFCLLAPAQDKKPTVIRGSASSDISRSRVSLLPGIAGVIVTH